MRRFMTLGLLAMLLTPCPLPAQSLTEGVGRKVVLKNLATQLRIEQQVIPTSQVFNVCDVLLTDGPWLWVASGESRGWVRSEDTVPWERAVDYFTAEIQKSPQPEPYTLRGFVRYARHEDDLAIRDFTEAIRLERRFAAAYHGRARCLARQKDYDRAIADYEQVIRLGTNLAMTQSFLKSVREVEQLNARTAETERQLDLLRRFLREHYTSEATRSAAQGDFESAILSQTLAVNSSVSEEEKTEARRRLESYRQRKPYREEPQAK